MPLSWSLHEKIFTVHTSIKVWSWWFINQRWSWWFLYLYPPNQTLKSWEGRGQRQHRLISVLCSVKEWMLVKADDRERAED